MEYAPLTDGLILRKGYFIGVNLVAVDKGDDDEVSVAIPEVAVSLYGELFEVADWAVCHRPWEQPASGPLFEVMDATGEECWEAFLRGADEGVAAFYLVRKSALKKTGEHGRLEVQFMASDFLQGHDYELNVRYAPESWDECERDVIVLRASDQEGGAEHPNAEQVQLLRDGLLVLKGTGV